MLEEAVSGDVWRTPGEAMTNVYVLNAADARGEVAPFLTTFFSRNRASRCPRCFGRAVGLWSSRQREVATSPKTCIF